MDARLAAGLTTVYDADNVSLHDFDGTQPRIRYEKDGRTMRSLATSSPVATAFMASAVRV
jgi:hypothetical protein